MIKESNQFKASYEQLRDEIKILKKGQVEEEVQKKNLSEAKKIEKSKEKGEKTLKRELKTSLKPPQL